MHKYETVTPEEISAVISKGESYTVEFKAASAVNELNDADIVKAVVCLANGKGGTLFIGVDDTGRVTGMAPRHGKTTEPSRLAAMILNKTEPPVSTVVQVVTVDEQQVGVVRVPPAASPVGTKSGLFVRRSTRVDGSPECVPYKAHEMIAKGLSAQGRDYAETKIREARLEDLSMAEFDRFRQLCRTGNGERGLAEASEEDILRALRLTDPTDGALALGSILLFGKESALNTYTPTAEILFQEEKAGKVVMNQGMRLPLLRAAERISELLSVRNQEQELIIGIHRVAVPRLPTGIVREAVANALIHRDYSELGPIAIRLTETELRVTSPGGFPAGITLGNFMDESKPRSVILADAFKRAGIVDRFGRGISQMYLELLRLGRNGPDYSSTTDKMVVVSVPTSAADLEMVRFVVEDELARETPLTLMHLRILHELKAAAASTVRELAEALGKPQTRTRDELARLGEMGLVEPRGVGRGRRYHLSPAFYRTAQASAYVRVLDIDPIQQKQMVVSYVDQFGAITRAKAAELCRLGPQQATSLLRSLVQSGLLEMRGERKGAHYVRAGGSQ